MHSPHCLQPATCEGSPGNHATLTKLAGNTGILGTLSYKMGRGGIKNRIKNGVCFHMADHILYAPNQGMLGRVVPVPPLRTAELQAL